MKKFLSALLSIVLCVTMLAGFSVSASGDLTTDQPDPIETERYQTISVIQAMITVSGSEATAKGTYSIRMDNAQVEITLTLEKSTNGRDWTEEDSWSFSRTAKQGVVRGTAEMEHGYCYHAIVEVSIYDSEGNYIETASVTSSAEYYK